MKTEKREGVACWHIDSQAQALRVELADGSFFVFPYTNFALAHFQKGGDADALHVSMTTHDLRITGKNLRELGMALQKPAVEWIKELPSRFNLLTNDHHVWIKSIEIHEAPRTLFPFGNKEAKPSG